MNQGRVSRRLVFALLAALAVYHAGLLGQGAFAYPDEHLYRNSLAAAGALMGGDLSGAAAALSGWGSRPAEYLVRLPAAFVQLGLERSIGLSPLSPASLPIVTAQNVAVAFLLALVFWGVSRKLLSEEAAALATVGFSLLTANQMWVRHVVPYDAALLAHLIAFGLALDIPDEAPHPQFLRRALVGGGVISTLLLAYPIVFNWARPLGLPLAIAILIALVAVGFCLRSIEPAGPFRSAWRTGVVSGIAMALYPAYYPFVSALGLFILLSARRDRVFSWSLSTVRSGLVFGGAVLLVAFVFEVLARIGDVSYLGGARLLASTIALGSFEEGFVFLGKWLWAVDAPAAAWLLPAIVVGAVTLCRECLPDRLSEKSSRLARICSILGALYLVYGFQSVVMHRMAFTGRYVRMYVPVVLWLAAFALSRIAGPQGRYVAFAAAATLSLGAFGRFALEYRNIGYPADVLYKLGIGYEDLRPENIRHEFTILPGYNLPVKSVTAGSAYVTRPGDPRFILVNFAMPSMGGALTEAIKGPSQAVLVHDSKHLSSLASSTWEGYSKEQRVELIRKQLHLRVYLQAH